MNRPAKAKVVAAFDMDNDGIRLFVELPNGSIAAVGQPNRAYENRALLHGHAEVSRRGDDTEVHYLKHPWEVAETVCGELLAECWDLWDDNGDTEEELHCGTPVGRADWTPRPDLVREFAVPRRAPEKREPKKRKGA